MIKLEILIMVISMKFMYKFFVNGGKFITICLVLFVMGIILTSLTKKGIVEYGGRCEGKLDEEIFISYNYEGIKLTSNYLGCNTYYLEYDSELDENKNILFLASLSKLLSDNGIKINTHVIIRCDEYQLISTIVDYNISYVKSFL